MKEQDSREKARGREVRRAASEVGEQLREVFTPTVVDELRAAAGYNPRQRMITARRLMLVVVEGFLLEEAVLDQISQVAEYRSSLHKACAKAGVIGDMKVSAVQRTELGVYTAAVSLTVVRCPDGPPETDERLRTLFEDGWKKVVVALPGEIDALQAALWYRGCRASGAQWDMVRHGLEPRT